MKSLIVALLATLCCVGCQVDTQHTAGTLSQQLKEVTKIPIKFEPGVISDDQIQYNSSYSAQHQEFYFSMAAPDFSFRNMMVSKLENGAFQKPQKLKLGGIVYDASDVQVTGDGSYLYFKMRSNVPNDTARRDGNVWRSRRTGDQWSAPKMLPAKVNSILSEYYPISTKSGNLYFSRENEETSYDIYCSRYVNGQFREAEPLPLYINTDLLESDAYVSPDESFMIFVRMYAADGLGVSDMYITFNQNGSWTSPTNMTSLNSPGVDGSPFVTADGKYLFFTSTRDSENPENFDGHLDIYVARFDVTDWM